MGNDGGSIPTRRELVKEAARVPTVAEAKESQQEHQSYLWTTDPVSRRPLVQPVVSDSAGKLYNKVTVLEYLLEGSRKKDFETVTHGSIKTLKDVVEVKFEVDEAAAIELDGAIRGESWKCPITGDRLGPASKAVYLVPCGHAFSGVAMKEVSGAKCLTCETEYSPNDVVPIASTATEDAARLALRVKTLQEKGLTHSLKKASGSGKKRKKRDEVVTVADDSASIAVSADPVLPTSTDARSVAAEPNSALNINNASTASLTAKVMNETDRSKKRKMENGNVRSLFSSRDPSKPHGRSGDFMTRGYSVPTHGK